MAEQSMADFPEMFPLPLLFLPITPLSRSTLVPITPFLRFSLVSSSGVFPITHLGLGRPVEEAGRNLNSNEQDK